MAVVITKSPLANPAFVGKGESTCDTSVSRSVATSPLILALVSHSTNWNPGGLSGVPPEAKLPSSHMSLMSLQRSGYLTATTEWYVTGLTLELDGSINPHAWMSPTPAVWELSTACMSPAMGRRVAACCKIQARRTRDRGKLTVVPASRLCPRLWGVVFAHAAGLLQIALSDRGGLCLPPQGLRWIVARAGSSIIDPACAVLYGGFG